MAHHQRAERNIFCNQVVVCTFPLGNPQAHSSNAQLIRGFKFQFICSNSIAADFQSYLPIHLKYLVWDPGKSMCISEVHGGAGLGCGPASAHYIAEQA